MVKKFMCMTLAALLLLAPAGCGGGASSESMSGGGTDGSDSPADSSSIPEPEEPDKIWNSEPVVKNVFYEDFAEGIDSDIWEVSAQKWGADNNGTSPDNVFFSTDKTQVENAGATGGIAVLRSYGDLQQDPSKRRQGSALITRQTFGPGKFEVRMKVLPRLGQCTAFWTYYSNGGKTPETIKYSEIDIEMPMEGSYRKWSGTSYERFIDWNILADRQTVMADELTDGGLNDGQWHTYAFEWRTDAENGDRGVVWYRDGVKMGEAREFVPMYKAALWVGNWFPPDKSWVGVPDFEEAYMYVDWIRVTEYEDPVEEGGGGSTARAEATDLGAEPIPVNDYIANGDFSAEENGALLGWEGEGGSSVGGENTYLSLSPSARMTQFIRAQYPGYSFTLSAEALQVTGSGKCKIYAEYMYGSVRMGASEAIEFTASDVGEKSLTFTIDNPMTSDLRIVIETEDGTTAQITGVRMLMN